MEYIYSYPSSSSLSKKLMIVITTLMLLIVTTPVATEDELYYCGDDEPFGYGPCTDEDNSCATKVLTYLKDNTPYSRDYKLDASHPNAYASGRYEGQASCESRFSLADCQSCLNGANNWLTTICVYDYYRNSGNYSYGICHMSFAQIS